MGLLIRETHRLSRRRFFERAGKLGLSVALVGFLGRIPIIRALAYDPNCPCISCIGFCECAGPYNVFNSSCTVCFGPLAPLSCSCGTAICYGTCGSQYCCYKVAANCSTGAIWCVACA
jgi:hypothetical protein